MTVSEAPATESQRNPLPRRARVQIAVTLGAIVLFAAGLITYERVTSWDDQYGPVSVGSFGGYGGADVKRERNGDLSLATVGNRTTYVYGSMGIDGTHTVRISGVDSTDVIVRSEWAPLPDDSVAIPQRNARWRSFPAVVPANTELQMRYTIRRPPHCQDKPMQRGVGEFYDDSHVVHWESLLHDHITTIGGYFDITQAIQIC